MSLYLPSILEYVQGIRKWLLYIEWQLRWIKTSKFYIDVAEVLDNLDEFKRPSFPLTFSSFTLVGTSLIMELQVWNSKVGTQYLAVFPTLILSTHVQHINWNHSLGFWLHWPTFPYKGLSKGLNLSITEITFVMHKLSPLFLALQVSTPFLILLVAPTFNSTLRSCFSTIYL